MNRHRLCIILLLVTLIFHRIIAEIVILNHRNHHFLQADTAMHEVHAAAVHLDTDAFSRRKPGELCFAIQELYRQ